MSLIRRRNTKPKSSAWNYFKKVTEADGNEDLSLVKYQCIYCDARYAGHATRLTKHLSRGCPKCPSSIADEFSGLLKYTMLEKRENKKCDLKCDNSKLRTDHEGISKIDWSQSSLSNRTLNGNVHNKIESVPQNEIEKLYARAFYSGGIPLNFTENEYWQEFLQLLEPNFKTPSKAKLSQQLLQREFQYIEGKLKQKVEETPVLGIQCMVSQNKKEQFELSFLLNVPQSLFYKSVTPQSKDEISYHLENEIISIMEQFGHKKLFILMTQDTYILESTDLLGEDNPNMVRFLCAVHSLNLFLADVFKLETACSFLAKSKIIIEEFSKFTSIPLPSEKNWKFVFKCCKMLKDNENLLKEIAVTQPPSLSTEVRSSILNDSYWSELKKFYTFLEPIIKWINDLSNEIYISQIVYCFYELITHIESLPKIDLFKINEIKNIKQSLLQKREMTVTPLHLAANILDPKFNGNYLTYEEQIEGCKYVDKISNMFYKNDEESAEEVLCEMAKYRCQEGIFKVPYVVKTSNLLAPDIWWKGSCYGLKLSRVAGFILSIPATAVSVESLTRLDSNYVAKKNGLNEDQMNKYMFVYKNLKLMHVDCNTVNDDTEESVFEESNVMQLMSEDDITEIEYEVSYDEDD